jgi:uncharacterized protein YdeI (YjbR/CyaY-like superfamily)
VLIRSPLTGTKSFVTLPGIPFHMPKKNPKVDVYIAEAADFAKPILKRLRKVVHAGCPAVEETIKWGFPHFVYKGNIAGMAAFQAHCSFGFWKGALIFRDKAEENEAMGQFGRITKLSDLPNEKTLIGYVQKAAELNDAGINVPRAPRPKGPRTLQVPNDFTAALKKNAKARKTFENFSYSNRKEYVEWVTGAKREETRQQRLATSSEWLAEGKSRNWKYER